jgi:hypothetical protein
METSQNILSQHLLITFQMLHCKFWQILIYIYIYGCIFNGKSWVNMHLVIYLHMYACSFITIWDIDVSKKMAPHLIFPILETQYWKDCPNPKIHSLPNLMFHLSFIYLQNLVFSKHSTLSFQEYKGRLGLVFMLILWSPIYLII